jgi:benzodiazapine receptor
MPVSRRLDLPRLLLSIVVCQAAGAIGGFATASSVGTWYLTLRKSPLNPPGWVFGPVWTILYTLMGIALYRAWMHSRRAGPDEERASFTPFWAQLGLNTAWSLVFFGLQQPLGALATLGALLLGILATIRSFARVDATAAWLLVPYAVWVAFAGYLNASVWWLNRD